MKSNLIKEISARTKWVHGGVLIFNCVSFRTVIFMFLLCLMMFVNVSSVFAQPGYGFSSTSGTYTAITGGTQLSSGGGMDNATFPITLPFTFNFNGTNYSQVYLSENGYMSFGSTDPGATTKFAISSTVSGFEVAAPFSYDLAGIGSGSELRYQVLGSSPNRTFVAQWSNVRLYYYTGETFSFQLRIDEGNGVINNQLISFVYGTCFTTSMTAWAQVGLRGNTNSSFINRTTTTNWAATTAGSTNADVCTITTTVAPSSGLTFIWTPLPMTYSSSTTFQATTNFAVPGSTNQQIIGVQVMLSGGVASPLSLTSLKLKVTGSSLASDIRRAKVFYTGSSSVFSTTNQFGSVVNSPTDSFLITGSQQLIKGVNYFWVAYDIDSGAIIGNYLDAQCSQLTIAANNYTPTVTDPAGSRPIMKVLNGVYTVGTGGDFSTLTKAANVINTAGVSGPVIFKLIDADYSASETFPIKFKVIPGASLVNSITIRPNAGVTPTIKGRASSIIMFEGTDYVTLDGSNSGSKTTDLTILNEDTNTSAVIAFGSLGTLSGATNNTVMNCNIIGGSTRVDVYGIFVAGTVVVSTSTGPDNDNITIKNNNIKRVWIGIDVAGTSTGLLDNLVISENVLGDANPLYTVSYFGISISHVNVALVKSNHISGISIPGGVASNICAIGIGGTINSGYIIGNIISGIRNQYSNGYGAYGISVGPGTMNGLNIINNHIADVSTVNYSTSSTTYNAFGIRIAASGTCNIYHNSVSLFGAVPNIGTTPHFSSAFLVMVPCTIDLRNNVFANTQTGLSGAKSYAVYSTIGNTSFVNTTNNNDYFVSGPNGILGYIGSADQSTLANWKSAIASPRDTSSINTVPNFNSNINLRPLSGSVLIGNGTPVSGITTDLMGATRSGTTPTIGAYEAGGEFIPPVISFTPLSNTISYTNRITSSFATISDASGIDTLSGTKPRLYFKRNTEANAYAGNTSGDNGWKWVEANNNSSPFDFTINYSLLTGGGVNLGDIIQYFVIAQDMASAPNVGWNTGSPNFYAFNTIPVSVSLSAVNFPLGGNIASFKIAIQLNGTYLIGQGQQITSLTNSGGFFDLVNKNVVSGNITAKITSNLNETGTIDLNSTVEINGSGYFISIVPDTTLPRTISGSYAGGLIRINGADRIKIDGHYGAMDSVNLFTIKNYQTSSNASCIQLISKGNQNGASNNTIRNCDFYMPRTGVNSYAISVGGETIGTPGSDNDSLSVLNNHFLSSTAGLIISGSPGNECDLVSIKGNTVDTAALGGFFLSSIRSLVVDSNKINRVVSISGMAPLGISLDSNVRNGIISRNIIRNVISSDQNSWGIYLGLGDSNLFISRNIIYKVNHTGSGGKGGKGIDINTSLVNSAIEIANNMVSDIGGEGNSILTSDANVGIRIKGGSGGVRLFHNTVNMYGIWNRTGATSDVSAAFAITSSASTNLDVRNNIFRNSIVNSSGTQTSYAIYSATTATTSFSGINYNNYFVTSAQGILGSFNGVNRNNLSDWKSVVSSDLYSQNQNLNFVDSTFDLRLAGASIGNLYLRSKSIIEISEDNFGVNRGKDITYMGAHEATTFSNLLVDAGSNATICKGQSITLGGTPTVMGGIPLYSYVWNPSSATTSNPVVNPATTTSFVVTVKDTMGFTSTDTVLVTVTVVALPTAAPTSVCQGHPAMLNATGSPQFKWYVSPTGGNPIDTGASILVSGITATTTFYVESYDGVCASDSRTPVVVTFNAKPDATFTILGQLAGQVTFKANALSGVNYNWNFGNSTTSIAASPTCVYTTNGNYNVKLVVLNTTTGCSDSTTTNVTVGTVGTGGKVVNGMIATAYPNPFENNVTIDYTISQTTIVSVKIVDLMGREVMNIPAEQQNAGKHQINWNAEHLSVGLYYARFNLNGQNYTLRLVKGHK